MDVTNFPFNVFDFMGLICHTSQRRSFLTLGLRTLFFYYATSNDCDFAIDWRLFYVEKDC